jgi:hypothetical protein
MEVFLLLLAVFGLSFGVYTVQSIPGSHADVLFFRDFAVVLSFDQIMSSHYACSLSVVLQVHIVYLGHNNGLSPSLTSESHLQLLSRVFTK